MENRVNVNMKHVTSVRFTFKRLTSVTAREIVILLAIPYSSVQRSTSISSTSLGSTQAPQNNKRGVSRVS